MQLSPTAQDILREEEELLAKALQALQAAAAAQGQGPDLARDRAALRELRDHAMLSSADDMPNVLHDLGVQQQVAAQRRETAPLPATASPYLAHLKVQEADGSTRDYLLGIATFLQTQSQVRILDWRQAPKAQIFFRYRTGDVYEEELPNNRVATGTVLARRMVVIEAGVLREVVAEGLTLRRQVNGSWMEISREHHALDAGGAGTAARPGILGVGAGSADRASFNVTARLDAEQYAAICTPPEQALVLLGSAGSGKTTVALHRLARLAAQNPEAQNGVVVVPEEGLARLARRLLEPLGSAAAQVQTLDAWATELAQSIFAKKMRISPDTPGTVASLKRHPAFYRAVRAHFAQVQDSVQSFKRLHRHYAEAISDRTFLQRVIEQAPGELNSRHVKDTVRHMLLQLQEPLSKSLKDFADPERLRTLDDRAVWEGTPDDLAGTVDLEDLPVLLFLRAHRAPMPPGQVQFLVLDETEDFSLFELYVLGKLLRQGASVTLAGDAAQQTLSSFAGWDASLEAMSVTGAITCHLSMSYRCPAPVVAFAQHLLGNQAVTEGVRAAREGAPVGCFHYPTEAQAQLFVAHAVRDLVDREPRAAIGVIASDSGTARQFFAVVRDMHNARLVLDGEFTFTPGIDITDVANAKGLEFDYVIVPDAHARAYPDTAEARRRLHVAATRASHQLWVVAGGAVSPLLAGTYLAGESPKQPSEVSATSRK